MPDPQTFNTIIQGGSFGVLVLIIVWFGYKVIPNALQTHKDTVADLVSDFREENKAREERHDKELARRDAALEKLTAAVDKLADKTAEHRSLLDECPYRKPPTGQ